MRLVNILCMCLVKWDYLRVGKGFFLVLCKSTGTLNHSVHNFLYFFLVLLTINFIRIIKYIPYLQEHSSLFYSNRLIYFMMRDYVLKVM